MGISTINDNMTLSSSLWRITAYLYIKSCIWAADNIKIDKCVDRSGIHFYICRRYKVISITWSSRKWTWTRIYNMNEVDVRLTLWKLRIFSMAVQKRRNDAVIKVYAVWIIYLFSLTPIIKHDKVISFFFAIIKN